MEYGKRASEAQVIETLVGNRVVRASDDTLTLSNGMKLRFEESTSDCCSWIELAELHTVNHIITNAGFESPDDDEGSYKAWIYVVTETGDTYKIAEADADASNGYYLHGFALGIEIIDARPEPASREETLDAINSILGTF